MEGFPSVRGPFKGPSWLGRTACSGPFGRVRLRGTAAPGNAMVGRKFFSRFVSVWDEGRTLHLPVQQALMQVTWHQANCGFRKWSDGGFKIQAQGDSSDVENSARCSCTRGLH